MSVSLKRKRRLDGFIMCAALVSVVTACSVDKLGPTPDAIVLPGSAKRPDVVGPKSVPGTDPIPETVNKGSDDATAEPEPLTLNVTTNFADGVQRKNLVQLKDAIINCVGTPNSTDDAVLKISNDMILYSPEYISANSLPMVPNNDGRKRFLLPDVYGGSYLGTSILDKEATFLDASSNRTGLTADSIEDSVYLKSLVTVASVVAFNCNVTNPMSNCYCADKVSAEQMVRRCLPQFSLSSDTFQEAVKELYSVNNCGAPDTTNDGLEKRRRAVAALLNSYAFATSK